MPFEGPQGQGPFDDMGGCIDEMEGDVEDPGGWCAWAYKKDQGHWPSEKLDPEAVIQAADGFDDVEQKDFESLVDRLYVSDADPETYEYVITDGTPQAMKEIIWSSVELGADVRPDTDGICISGIRAEEIEQITGNKNVEVDYRE